VTSRLLLLLALAWICAACGTAPKPAQPTGPVPTGYNGFVIQPPVQAPAFSLRDQNGKAVGPQSVRGNWFVVAFLYTHCPDVCPLIASNLATAQRLLPNLHVLAISVDPKRDTRSAVRQFIELHHLPARFHYLTGSRAQLRPVWASYHVATLTGPSNIVSHSAFELLVDPSGHERLLYAAQLRAVDLTHDIAKLARH
jgi:protein SCO1/2